MKKILLNGGLVLLAATLLPGVENPRFDDYFTPENLRVDYYHTADGQTDFISIDRFYRQGEWAGNPRHLIDPFNNGMYYVKLYDSSGGRLIYSRGFNSYCGEYKTLPVAKKGVKKTFHETVRVPFPRGKVELVLEARDRRYRLNRIFSRTIDPRTDFFHTEPRPGNVRVFPLHQSGPSAHKVDLLIVAEGYRREELDKVRRDFSWVVETLRDFRPYSAFWDRFNILGVFCPSEESGSDQPTHGVYRRTLLDSSYNSLGLYRYLLFENNRALGDVTAGIPCDTLVVMANNERYGGGGIYNSFCIFSIDNPRARYLLLHEFGHSFAGLADEYYSSSVAYDEFYPPGVEPLEPNITALLDKGKVKWSECLTAGVPVPTPWEKNRYEQLTQRYQEVRGRLQTELEKARERKQTGHLKKLEARIQKLTRNYQGQIMPIFSNEEVREVVGAFEGAGYAARGLFRPMVDCIMFSTSKMAFCRVCEGAVIKVIRFLTD